METCSYFSFYNSCIRSFKMYAFILLVKKSRMGGGGGDYLGFNYREISEKVFDS